MLIRFFSTKIMKCITILLLLLVPLSLQGKSKFLDKYDSKHLDDIFTVNIGIMELKRVGKLSAISPIDSKNVIDTIKNVLDDVPAIKLSKKGAVLKASHILLGATTNADDKLRIQFLRRKLFFARKNTSSTLIGQLFKEIRKNKNFYSIAKVWFENIESPIYSLKVGVPFSRQPVSEEDICMATKIKIKPDASDTYGPLDLLFHGEIERIGKLYVITIYVYSDLLKKEIYEFSVVAESEMINKTIGDKIRTIIPVLFHINYASLDVSSNDEDVRVYLDDNYIGRKDVSIPFLVPGPYVVTLKKENFENHLENISLAVNEKRQIELSVDQQKKLQLVNFHIEPLGTKIFVNAVFQGRSPFAKALPIGEYVISAKNDLFDDYRYVMKIEKVDKEKPLNVVFHLKSKEIKTQFSLKKSLYYIAFWNFTFSLVVTIPMAVLGYYFWDLYVDTSAIGDYNTFNNVRTGTIITVIYMGLSLGWLFYSLADYLLTLEKKDYIPILEYYQEPDGSEGLTIGMHFSL